MTSPRRKQKRSPRRGSRSPRRGLPIRSPKRCSPTRDKLYRGKKSKREKEKTKAEEGPSSSHDSKQWSKEDTDTLMIFTEDLSAKILAMKENEDNLIKTFQTFISEVTKALRQNKRKHNVDDKLTIEQKNEFNQQFNHMHNLLKEYLTEFERNNESLSNLMTKYEGHPLLTRQPYVGVTSFEKELTEAREFMKDFTGKFMGNYQAVNDIDVFEKPVFDSSELIKGTQKLNVNDTPKATKDTIGRQEQDKMVEVEKAQQEEKRRKELREAHK